MNASRLRKFVLLGGVLALAALLLVFITGSLSLENLVAREAVLRQWQHEQPALVLCVVFAIYVAVTGLSLPGAVAMSLVIGWYVGFVTGTILVSFASTLGATIAFLLSRYFLRDWVQARFGERLMFFNRAIEREGAFYLFTLRLIPQVPFFVINAVMGLTSIRTRTFWWVSQLGMLPGTCVILYAGSSVPDLATLARQGVSGILAPKVLIAFLLLGIFPIAVKYIVARIRRTDRRATTSSPETSSPRK